MCRVQPQTGEVFLEMQVHWYIVPCTGQIHMLIQPRRTLREWKRQSLHVAALRSVDRSARAERIFFGQSILETKSGSGVEE